MFNINEKLTEKEAKQLSSITLAFIGDAVYTLYVREKLVYNKDEKGSELNRKTSKIVCATAQAVLVNKILPILTEDELLIYKRARNAKKTTRSKSASVKDYVKSTGLEALIGYLYIVGDTDRLNYLLNFGEETDEN